MQDDGTNGGKASDTMADETAAGSTIASTTMDRAIWIGGAMTVMADGGVNAVKIEPLSRRLGVTKGSFYWHFRNRPALLTAMLEHWEEQQTEALFRIADDPDGSPADKLRRLFETATGQDAAESEARHVELAIRDWARSDTGAMMAVRAVDARRSVYVENFFVALGCTEADARARAGLFHGLLFAEAMLTRDEEPEERAGRVARSLGLLVNIPAEDSAAEEGAAARPRPVRPGGMVLGGTGSRSVN